MMVLAPRHLQTRYEYTLSLNLILGLLSGKNSVQHFMTADTGTYHGANQSVCSTIHSKEPKRECKGNVVFAFLILRDDWII
jgi:hypothetical protein